jgi:tellurite resistance protein
VNIQSIQLAPNVGFSDFNGYLTPEALMTYCQTRLQGIDTQVQKAFAEQQAMNKSSEMLGNLANSINLPSQDLDLSQPADFKQALAAAKQLQAAADSAQDPDTKKALQAAADKVFAKLTKVLKDKEQPASTFDTINASTSDADVDNILTNNSKGSGSISDDNKKYSVDSFKSDTTDSIHNIQQQISSSAELSMINLQSLMSQRQEAIQLATNLVQSLGDQCNKIADNVGK